MLDWMMPGIDGPALLRKMRENAGTRAMPVVFVTAKASQRELAELRALGAAGAISKPSRRRTFRISCGRSGTRCPSAASR
jgi:CheY-like chemotaxis protein